jgi:hypothetical protein
MKTRAQMIEAEARRLCAIGGYDPDMPANKLLSVREPVPLWRIYARHLENDIDAVERAGFSVKPRANSRALDNRAAAVVSVLTFAPFLLIGAAIILGWV